MACDIAIQLDKKEGYYSSYNRYATEYSFHELSPLIFDPLTVHHIPLPPAAGVGMAGQQRQQVAALLYLDLIHLMGLDDLNVGHRVGQRFP